MLRIIIPSFLLNLFCYSFAQETASVDKQQQIIEMHVDRDFNRKYKSQLHLLKRTYPMAIKAKSLIDEYEADLADISKKRNQKKYGKKAHADLKDEFLFNIKDLYNSEGDLLMKLVHRETGMTVNEIVKKYRGGMQNGIYSGIALLFGQDINATYDATGVDWVTEVVINDIESGRISFDTKMIKMNKSDYKESMTEYRNDKKKSRATIKTQRKERKNKSK